LFGENAFAIRFPSALAAGVKGGVNGRRVAEENCDTRFIDM
jgi:hypothetical protein